MSERDGVKWLEKPADSDYVAAESYLSLLYKPKQCKKWVERLRAAPMSEYPAKDILRASGTRMAEVAGFDWSKQREELSKGKPLSPILLVRQENGGHLIVADGFHRMCALFSADEKLRVPCKIV